MIANSTAHWVCRICGCTDSRACDERCSWIEPGLCSSCTKPRVDWTSVGLQVSVFPFDWHFGLVFLHDAVQLQVGPVMFAVSWEHM